MFMDLGFEKDDVGESGCEMAHDVPRFTLPIGGGDATSCYKSQMIIMSPAFGDLPWFTWCCLIVYVARSVEICPGGCPSQPLYRRLGLR